MCASFLLDHRQEIQRAIEKGSVIIMDRGVRALATVAAQDDAYRRELFPYPLEPLRTCRSKDPSGRAEAVRVALEQRLPETCVPPRPNACRRASQRSRNVRRRLSC